MPYLYNDPSKKSLRKLLRRQQTYTEQRLWTRLRNGKLHGIRFRRQYGIGRYVVDLYCPRYRVVIEIDGATHFSETAREADSIRQQWIESQGIRVFRVAGIEIFEDLEGVIERVYRYLRMDAS